LRWKLATILFLIGLCMRLPVFGGAHEEGDELIYMNLVLQLDAGHGYTLHGSPLLEQGKTDKDEYDRPLFFHPPGGTALNWVFFKMFGGWGFPIVQLFSYVLFFWSMMLLAYSLQLTASNLALQQLLSSLRSIPSWRMSRRGFGLTALIGIYDPGSGAVSLGCIQ